VLGRNVDRDLVIGISDYQQAPRLINPVRDAGALVGLRGTGKNKLGKIQKKTGVRSAASEPPNGLTHNRESVGEQRVRPSHRNVRRPTSSVLGAQWRDSLEVSAMC
jgi:hypothetical protein